MNIFYKIPGYQGKYSMNMDGKIRSNARTIVSKHGVENDIPARILSTRNNNRGLEIVDLYDGKKKVTRSVKKIKLTVKELN